MRIEKINDNQIKCTLYRSDLAAHQIRLTELAYGTEKTRGLLWDMVEQASDECGFEVNDNPLMIEATPVSMDCIVLMVTRVDNPEDIDTDFLEMPNLVDLLAEDPVDEDTPLEPKQTSAASPLRLMYSFDDLDSVIEFARRAVHIYNGENSLYKSRENERFYLVLSKSDLNLKDFAAVSGMALEYGVKEPLSYAREAFIDEHFDHIVSSDALQKLASV